MNIHDPFNLLRTKKDSIGKPPGTLHYSGEFPDVDIRIDLIKYDMEELKSHEVKEIRDLKDLLEEARMDSKVHWINITGLHNHVLIRTIGEQLDVHPMDLEDIIHVSQWSKIQKNTDYLFSVFKMIYLKEKQIIHEHLSVILRENVIITFQESSGDVFDHVRERINNPNSHLRSGDSNYLYYTLMDAIIDEYLVVINQISINFNKIEMEIVEESNPDKEDMYQLRKELLYFSNALSPLMDSLRLFMAKENPYYRKDLAPYYADVYEHLNQIANSIRAYREMSNGLHEMQMSNANLELNRTMMTLTIFSVIFIPLSFLTGVFGMNFAYLPGLHEPFAFTIFVFVCLAVAGGMLSYFKLKRW